MRGKSGVLSCSQDVIPKLLAFFFSPGIRSLIDWNHELRGLLQKNEEIGFAGFHAKQSTVNVPQNQQAEDPAPGSVEFAISASVHYRDTDIRHLGRHENAMA